MIVAELHQVQVNILLEKKTIPDGSGRAGTGRAGWLDDLEIGLNSAQLGLELG